ncbi:hypothetical protein GO755_35340 [Spirosoma sp. HMF4905]|uniref:Polymerase nucleotidyl transferase domain-containing protein n=1 Tax=Spirosoma arboris TaxID=2682092 RepID=A0A7K1SNJ3_9BACT|nr:hypothetical protein [Spirosoma arboris]MVM35351.1 hypothetical protein [Spirosoma arboris]
MKNNKQETLNILVYSDIFHYPLTKKEIYERGKIEMADVEICLRTLIQENKVFLFGDFYTLQNNKEIVENRLKRNALAQEFMIRAKLITKIIINFPFIRGILLSGSMSKNCMDEDSDIDFFIITEPGKLWVAHLFCSLFKKIFLLNDKKYFCYNFFLDSDHLRIDHESIYTAMEIKTLIPLYGYSYYELLLKQNEWANNYFPNQSVLSNVDVAKKQTYIQKIIEFCLNNPIGDFIDREFLTWSIKRRRKRLEPKLFANPNFYTNLQSHIAKAHITDTYPNIIKEYCRKVKEYSY